MPQPPVVTLPLADEAATTAAGGALARALSRGAPGGALVTLGGELGAGKTTLVRGLLRALGVAGAVRSPTYTLLESYPVGGRMVHHFDWYRLGAPDDLEALGFRDLGTSGAWLLVEWPERIPAAAAGADLALELGYAGDGRTLAFLPRTPVGLAVHGAFLQQAL